jgi:hypothetical protein
MHPTAALMLSRSVEDERRRVLSHRRAWLDGGLRPQDERRTPLSALFRLPLVARIANAKA